MLLARKAGTEDGLPGGKSPRARHVAPPTHLRKHQVQVAFQSVSKARGVFVPISLKHVNQIHHHAVQVVHGAGHVLDEHGRAHLPGAAHYGYESLAAVPIHLQQQRLRACSCKPHKLPENSTRAQAPCELFPKRSLVDTFPRFRNSRWESLREVQDPSARPCARVHGTGSATCQHRGACYACQQTCALRNGACSVLPGYCLVAIMSAHFSSVAMIAM